MLPLQVTARRLEDMPPHDQKNAQALLETLATTALDSARGYDLVASHTHDPGLRKVFEDLANRRRVHATQLGSKLDWERRERAASGSTLASLHRALIEVRAALDHEDVSTLLVECERGDHVAIERYETGLQERLPEDVATLLLDQVTEIRETRAAFDRMRT